MRFAMSTTSTARIVRLTICTTALILAGLIVTTPVLAEQNDRKERRAERRQAIEAMQRGEYDLPTSYWREGPVRYLLSQDEDHEFRALESQGERESYIKRFWAARDPDPSTPGNQFRDLFYRRVVEANKYFSASTKPGWLTDRGKIFVILGPPDELDQRYYRQNSPAVALWTYREPPEGSNISPNSVIRFVRDFSGEFRLSNSFRLSWHETVLSIGLQIQAMQVKSLPQPQDLLDAIVSAEPAGDVLPFRVQHEFFGGGPGETIAILTLGVQEEMLRADGGEDTALPGADAALTTRLEAVARLVREGGEGLTYDLAGVNGLRAGVGDGTRDSDGYLLFQGGAPIAPGRYAAYFGIFDKLTGHIHSYRDAFEVPFIPGDGITVSNIALASKLERLSGRSAFGYSAPFLFGNLRAVPRAGDNLDSSEDLLIYYQVHGIEIDSIDGRPDFDVEYRIMTSRGVGPNGEPAYTPFGNPIYLTHLQNPVQGYSLPLLDWPPATYRLEVEVTDNLSGERSVNGMSFRVN